MIDSDTLPDDMDTRGSACNTSATVRCRRRGSAPFHSCSTCVGTGTRRPTCLPAPPRRSGTLSMSDRPTSSWCALAAQIHTASCCVIILLHIELHCGLCRGTNSVRTCLLLRVKVTQVQLFGRASSNTCIFSVYLVLEHPLVWSLTPVAWSRAAEQLQPDLQPQLAHEPVVPRRRPVRVRPVRVGRLPSGAVQPREQAVRSHELAHPRPNLKSQFK